MNESFFVLLARNAENRQFRFSIKDEIDSDFNISPLIARLIDQHEFDLSVS